MQRETDSRKRQQDHEVVEVQRFCLKDRLQWREIDEEKLRDEGDSDSRAQHSVLGETAREASILDSRHEIEKDEGCESLRDSDAGQHDTAAKVNAAHHGLVSLRCVAVTELHSINEQCASDNHRRGEGYTIQQTC